MVLCTSACLQYTDLQTNGRCINSVSLEEYTNFFQTNKTEDMVFINSKGGITKYYTLRNNFNRFCEANGLGEIELNFHKFRHTFCTKLAENNVSIAIAQSLMEHSDPAMTVKVYTHVNMKMKNIGIEAMKNAYDKIS